MKWKWIVVGAILFSIISIASAVDNPLCMILDKKSDNPICMFLDSLQADIGSDCPAGQCVYGVNDDGSLDCRACAGGDGGTNYWIDAGNFLYPNMSVANNTWIMYGFLNVTEWFKVYDYSIFYDDVNITKDLNVDGNVTTTNLTVNVDASISNNLDLGQDMNLGGSINESSGKSYWKFDGGAIVIHLEE